MLAAVPTVTSPLANALFRHFSGALGGSIRGARPRQHLQHLPLAASARPLAARVFDADTYTGAKLVPDAGALLTETQPKEIDGGGEGELRQAWGAQTPAGHGTQESRVAEPISRDNESESKSESNSEIETESESQSERARESESEMARDTGSVAGGVREGRRSGRKSGALSTWHEALSGSFWANGLSGDEERKVGGVTLWGIEGKVESSEHLLRGVEFEASSRGANRRAGSRRGSGGGGVWRQRRRRLRWGSDRAVFLQARGGGGREEGQAGRERGSES
jgi:hypothetical protein